MTASTPRPAAREPMLWLVIALPLAAVIAGIATLVLALRHGGADAVPSEVRRTAQIQVADVHADRQALDAGLSAVLDIDASTGAVALRLHGARTEPASTLQLELIHPVRADADRTVALVASGSTWHGRIDAVREHAWNLRLSAPDARWRLVGRLERVATEAMLQPALRE